MGLIMKILSFGEVLWDVYPDKKFIGGAPLNFAAHLAKHNEDVSILTSVGDDELGIEALKNIEKLNICTHLIQKNHIKETGKCFVSLNEKQIPSYNLLNDVAYDYIDCSNIKEKYDILYFGTLALRGEYNNRSLKQFVENNKFKEIFVDVNIRPPFYNDDVILFALNRATIIKISEEELPVILKAIDCAEADVNNAAEIICEKFSNLKFVIITCGSKGSIILNCKTKEIFSCQASKTKAVSTVGAGDSFSAGFLHKYLKGEKVSDSLKYATRIADFVVSRYEAIPDYSEFLTPD